MKAACGLAHSRGQPGRIILCGHLTGARRGRRTGVPRDDPAAAIRVGPRLVYADWLEEQGEAPRAELLRQLNHL